MNLNEIPRGQLSTIILSSLLDGDKYGYEIIDSIQERTNGEIAIKKPSLYSTLTRLEKQDLVSSYWKDSDIGGKRHYYRLTDFGKKQVLQWQEQLYASQNKLAQILQGDVKQSPTLQQTALGVEEENNKEQVVEHTVKKEDENKSSSEIFLKQVNLFSLAKEKNVPNQANNEDIKNEALSESHKQDFIQYDLFSNTSFIAAPDVPTFYEEIVYETKNKLTENQEKIKIEQVEEKTLESKEQQDISPKNQIENKLEEKANLFKQSISQLLEKETEGFEERLLNAKKSFNFEAEYKKYLKQTKSFAETFDSAANSSQNNEYASFKDISNSFNGQENKSFAGAEGYTSIEEEPALTSLKKLSNQFEDTSSEFKNSNLFSNKSYAQDLKEIEEDESDIFLAPPNKVVNSFLENDLSLEKESQMLERANNQFDDAENKNEEKLNSLNLNIKTQDAVLNQHSENNELSKKEEAVKKETDSIVIVDKLEFAPRVRKIEPASFSHLNKNKLPEKRVRPLSEQNGQVAFSNQQIETSTQTKQPQTLQENNFKNLAAKKYFESFGIKVGEYNPNQKQTQEKKKTKFKTSGKKDYINHKKFKFFASAGHLLLFAIQIVAMLIVLNAMSINYSNSIWLVFATLGISVIWTICTLVLHLTNKKEKILKKNILIMPLWQKLCLISIFLMLVYSVHLISGMDVENVASFALTLALPVLISFNVVVYHFASMFALRK